MRMNLASWLVLIAVIVLVAADIWYLRTHRSSCSGVCSECGSVCKWSNDLKKARRDIRKDRNMPQA